MTVRWQARKVNTSHPVIFVTVSTVSSTQMSAFVLKIPKTWTHSKYPDVVNFTFPF